MGKQGKGKPRLTADEVARRIAHVRAELESLIDDIIERTGVDVCTDDLDTAAPDAGRLIEARWMVGAATGLQPALSALEIERDEIERALEPAETQRKRRDEVIAGLTPAAALKSEPGDGSAA